MYPTYTFPVVLAWTTQYILSDIGAPDLAMKDATNGEIINIFQDSQGDIQITITDEAENDLDGGGCVSMEDLPENIDDLTPEQITQLITDKALFIWQLCHER